MTHTIRTSAAVIFLLLAVCFPLAAKDYTPQELPNPNIADRHSYVADPAGYLSAAMKEKVNARLDEVRHATSAEVAVAIVPSTGDTPDAEFAQQLFSEWGLGKSDKDNGVLLLLVPEQKRIRIHTGYGAEGVLPDIACAKIGRSMVPYLKEGDIDAAIDKGTASIAGALTDPSVAEELRSDEPDNTSGQVETLSSEVVMQFLQIIALGAFLAGLFLFCRDLWKGRRKSRYVRATMWKRNITLYIICTVLSLGTGLIFLLLAAFFYRSARTRPMKCDTCGARMRRLNEQEDNAYLQPSQDLEERLDTVDYDVWVCDKCGTIEKFPFEKKQSRYTKCPNCGTVACHLECDKIIVPPTTRREGKGEKIYKCEYCGHRTRHPYVIPKKDDGALLAAGAIGALGAGSGRGFSGGGFGGGASGGGGASVGW